MSTLYSCEEEMILNCCERLITNLKKRLLGGCSELLKIAREMFLRRGLSLTKVVILSVRKALRCKPGDCSIFLLKGTISVNRAERKIISP